MVDSSHLKAYAVATFIYVKNVWHFLCSLSLSLFTFGYIFFLFVFCLSSSVLNFCFNMNKQQKNKNELLFIVFKIPNGTCVTEKLFTQMRSSYSSLGLPRANSGAAFSFTSREAKTKEMAPFHNEVGDTPTAALHIYDKEPDKAASK